MKKSPPNLTEEQETTLLYLGGEDEGDRTISKQIIDDLLAMGLLHERGPNHIDLTDEGERVYELLGGTNI